MKEKAAGFFFFFFLSYTRSHSLLCAHERHLDIWCTMAGNNDSVSGYHIKEA